jgi:hypothetical protein
MEDNETEEEESKNDEWDPEDESHLTLHELFDNQFGRDLRRQLEQDFGSVLFTVARREVTYQAIFVGHDSTQSKFYMVFSDGGSSVWKCRMISIPTNTGENSTDVKVTSRWHTSLCVS